MSTIRINWKRLLVLFATVFLVIQVIGSFFFYELAVKRGPKEFLQNNADLEVSDEAMELFMNGSWIDWVMRKNLNTLR